jgi:hypothetical protein
LRRLAISLLLGALIFARAAVAQDRDDAQVATRLQQIETSFDEDEMHANVWFNGWLGIFTISAIGSATVSLTTDPGDVPVWRLGALRSGLGMFSVLLAPCPAVEAPSMLRALPESTPAERLAKLRLAEDQLHRAAKMERLTRSWLAHTSSIVVSAAFSFWIWRGYHHAGAALLSFGTGVLASEAKISTAPTRAIDDEAALEAGLPITPHESLGRQLIPRFSIAPMPNGVAFGGTF